MVTFAVEMLNATAVSFDVIITEKVSLPSAIPSFAAGTAKQFNVLSTVRLEGVPLNTWSKESAV